MRSKFLLWILLGSMLLSGCGHAKDDAPSPALQESVPIMQATTLPTEEPEVIETPAAEPTAPEQIAPKSRIFLTVSRITFDLAGESENVYMGTAPLEDVTWYSEDEQIATVEDGTVTAVAAGTTQIHAEYYDQHLSCEIVCLASSQEELDQVDESVLRTAKRIPAESDYDRVPFFAQTAIVGDSISMIFGQMEMKSNSLGHPLFLARGGCSINGYLKHYKELFYKGKETPLADAIADSGVKYIFMMLGENDLGYLSVEETLENYEALIAYIREQNPDLIIFLQTCTPEIHEGRTVGSRNTKIYEFNSHLPEFAEQNNCYLVDMAKYAENHFGSLAPEYVYDLGIHLNYDGCLMWAQVLANHAELYEQRIEEAA